jgi:hypothetical protein
VWPDVPLGCSDNGWMWPDVASTRSALLLLGGDQAGNWQRWYKENIPIAERLYLDYTTEAEE